MKGLVKPKLVSQEVEINDGDDDEDDAINELGSLRLGLGKGGIMDQAMINAIRAKRERLRQSRAAAPDYIALDGGSNHGEAEGLSDEEPEFQGRIALIGEKVDSKKGVFEDSGGKLGDSGIGREEKAEVNGDDNGVDEEDEEDKMWEEEQVRKGLGRRMDDGDNCGVRVSSTSSVPLVHQTAVQQAAVYLSAAPVLYPSIPSGPSIGGAVGWYVGSNVMSTLQQAELSKKALKESVARLKVCLLCS